MTKEKQISLTRYLQDLNNRLTSVVPKKHKNNPESFKAFLKNEIRLVSNKLDAAKLAQEVGK